MARKRYAAEAIIGHLREAEGVLAPGESVAPVARRLGVAEPTYYRGRREDGGRRVDPAKRLKERERANSRRKRVVADQARANAMLRDGAAGTFCARPTRRRATSSRPDQDAVSERRAGPGTGQARATPRSVPRPSPDAPALIARSVARAPRCGRSGSRRIPARLRQEGWRVNPKRVARRWRQAGGRVPGTHPQRGRRWLAAGARVRRRAERPSPVWSSAFVFDRPAEGRPVRILALGDADHPRVPASRRRPPTAPRRRPGAVGPAVRRARAAAVSGVRQRPGVHRHRGAGLAAPASGCTTRFIEPGRPWENGDGESFNGTLRDACRNRERFDTLLEAPILIEGWRRASNPIRPHRALGYRPPAPETQQPRERPMTLVPAIGLT